MGRKQYQIIQQRVVQKLPAPPRLTKEVRDALQTVYDLACEMSFDQSYYERLVDDNGHEHLCGREIRVLKALNIVRVAFGLVGDEEKP
jgi:hypothetical protein